MSNGNIRAKSKPFLLSTINVAAPFCENNANIYFDTKHLEKGLNSGWWNVLGPFFRKSALLLKNRPFGPISSATLIF